MPAPDLALLIDAARQAGVVAMKHWKQDPQVWTKPDDAGPVTEADLEIDTLLQDVLIRARPDYGWLSEESTDDPKRLATQRQFIVDPIDGTRAFIKGEASFSHALAIAEGGRIIAGVVYLPATDQMYAAYVGQGATLNGAPIQGVARAKTPPDLLTTKPNFAPENWPGGVPQVTRHFRSSLAYRMALAAEGRFDGMLTLRDSWEWDIAAGALICAEAGLQVSDRLGGPLLFNNALPKTAGAMALPLHLHTDFIAKLT